jgi:hypothetical protein
LQSATIIHNKLGGCALSVSAHKIIQEMASESDSTLRDNGPDDKRPNEFICMVCACLNSLTPSGAKLLLRWPLHRATKPPNLQNDIANIISGCLVPTPKFGGAEDADHDPDIIIRWDASTFCALLIIKPYPLGQVAMLSAPRNRQHNFSGSLPVNVTAWLGRLAQLPPAMVLQRPLTVVTTIRPEEPVFPGLCVFAEGNKVDNKLGDGDALQILKFLKKTLNPCVMSTPENGTAVMRIGVLDDPVAIVGITKVVAERWENAFKEYVKGLFPPLPAGSATVTKADVVLPQGPSKMFSIVGQGSGASSKFAVKCFLGKAKFDDSQRHFSVLEADLEFVHSCALAAKNGKLTAPSSDDPWAKHVHQLMQTDKARDKCKWLLDRNEWKDPTASDVVEFGRRYLLTMLVRIPDSMAQIIVPAPKCQFATMFDREEIGTGSFATSASTSNSASDMLSNSGWGAVRISSSAATNFSSSALPNSSSAAVPVEDHLVDIGDTTTRFVSPFNIWLRAKGLSDGAIKSNLLCPLLFGSFTKLLFCKESELRSVQRTVRMYAGQGVSIDHTFLDERDIADVAKYEYLVRVSARPLLIICSWSCRDYCKSVLYSPSFVSSEDNLCLVLCDLDEEIDGENIVNSFAIQVADVIALWPGDFDDLVDDGEDVVNDSFVEVPSSSLVDKQVLDYRKLFDNWINTGAVPSWELVNTVVFDSQAVVQGLRIVNHTILTASLTGRKVSHIQILKKLPGIGASCVLRRIGRNLQSATVKVFCWEPTMSDLQHATSTSIFVQRLSGLSPPASWVVLVDEHKQAAEAISAIKTAKINDGVHITIISVCRKASQTEPKISISPWLSDDDLSKMIRLLAGRFPEKQSCLSDLEKYCKQHPHCNERHIYVVMLTAYRKSFLSATDFLSDTLRNITSAEVQVIHFLALLSLFAEEEDNRWIPSPFWSTRMSPAFSDLVHRRPLSVSFFHPLLAKVLLFGTEEPNPPVSILRSLAAHLNVISKFALKDEDKEHICQTLFSPKMRSGKFSILVEMLFSSGADDRLTILLELLDVDAIQTHFKKFSRSVLLSRWMRHSMDFNAALRYALAAQECANLTFSYLAASNLAEVYACLAIQSAKASDRHFAGEYKQMMLDQYDVATKDAEHGARIEDRRVSRIRDIDNASKAIEIKEDIVGSIRDD